MGEVIEFPSRSLTSQKVLTINVTKGFSLKRGEIRWHYWEDLFVRAGAFIFEEIIKEPEQLRGVLFIFLKHPNRGIIFEDKFEYGELTLGSMLAIDIIRIKSKLIFEEGNELTLNAHCIPLPQVIKINDWLRARRTRGSRK